MFNNAGIGIGGEVVDMTLAHFDRAVDVNLRGVVHGVLAAYRVMTRQGRGHIVNTASLAGLVPAPGITPYSMTKHAVVGLSLSLRAEAAKHGVRVSVICPGVIDTPILDRPNPGDLPPVRELVGGREALERMVGKAYPPELLARDVLAGVARNRPHHRGPSPCEAHLVRVPGRSGAPQPAHARRSSRDRPRKAFGRGARRPGGAKAAESTEGLDAGAARYQEAGSY